MDLNQFAAIVNGTAVPGGGPMRLNSAVRTALKCPILNTSLASYCQLLDGPGASGSLCRIIFGKRSLTSPGTITFPTLAITDDGSTGYGGLKLMSFPNGVVDIQGVFPSVRVTVSGSWTVTSPVFAIGSATATTGNATLTTTEANLFPSTAVTLTSRIGSFTGDPLTAVSALTDSSGGTAAATVTTVFATYVTATMQNNFATVAAQLNNLQALMTGSRGTFGTSSTNLDIYINFAVNSDPSSGQTVTLGDLSDDLNDTPSYIDIWYKYRSGIAPPKHSLF